MFPPLFAVFSMVWGVAAILELVELVEPIDGTTHALSFHLMLGLALLNLIMSRVSEENA